MSSENERISNVLFIWHCNSLHQKLMIVPGSYSCLCSETNQLIWTRISFKSTFSDPGSGNLPCSMVGHLLAGILISSLLITLKQNQVKVAPAFADGAWKHLQLPWHWGLTVESELHADPIGWIFDSGRGVFSSASSWIVSTTPLSPATWNWTSLACSYTVTTSMISSSTSAKRSVAWLNSPLHKLLCLSQKVACCLTCA